MARVNPIPEGCHSVQPYMMFSECAKAMEFYTKAFGAREVYRFQGENGQVHHAEMQIGDSRIMMLSNRCYISISHWRKDVANESLHGNERLIQQRDHVVDY